MPNVSSGDLTRSQIEECGTAHLTAAATSWSTVAPEWERHYTAIQTGMLAPGGTAWEGPAADAAQDRAWRDLVEVRGLVNCLHDAVSAVQTGAGDIAGARRRALDAISEAEGAGFTVGEDLSVTDRSMGPLLRGWEARLSEARELAAEIQSQARNLASADKAAAASIDAALAPLDGLHFAGAPGVEDVQTVGLKTAPASPDEPLSEARRRAIEYADRWAGNAGDPHRANPDFENFGDGGGDCTNFASQVMRAGGFRDVGDGIDDWHRGDADDWYYNNGFFHFPGNTRSNTWSVAQANRDFVVNSGRGHVVGTSPMPANVALDPLAPSKAGLVPGDLIYYHDEATGTINHTAVYVGQKMQNDLLVDVVDQHAVGANNFHDDWMPDNPGFTGGRASVEFVHLRYPGD